MNLPDELSKEMAEVNARLTQGISKANQLHREFAVYLEKHGPKVYAETDSFHSELVGEESIEYHFAYGRTKSGWAPLIRQKVYAFDHPDQPGDPYVKSVDDIPLESSSRVLIIKSSEMIGELMARINKAAKELLDKIDS